MIHKVSKKDISVSLRKEGAKTYVENLKQQLALPNLTPDQKTDMRERLSSVLKGLKET